MSTAKTAVMNLINYVPDDIQDELDVIEGLYKLYKLNESKKSILEYGTFSTEEVRAHFEY